MADVTPPAATSSDKKKPEKPDEEAYKTKLKAAEKEHAESMERFNKVKAKLDIALPKSKDSPAGKRKQELLDERSEIQKQQAGNKGGRNQIFEQIKKLDEQLKNRIAEQKAARSRINFKNVEELDREIERLEKQVNGGMMKLVDEKKALGEISSLRKQRKGFAGFDEAQKGIDDTKKKLKELRDSLDDPAAKALSDRYNKVQSELNAIKAEQDEAFKNLNSLRDERTKLHAEQQEKYTAIKKIKDEYYGAKKAFQQYEFEARQRARDRQRAEREAFDKQKRLERAEKMLEEARYPAYSDELRRASNLLNYFDPSNATEAAPLIAPSKFTAEAQRTVDDSNIKGVKVVGKKDREEDYFAGTGGKKGKKGKKGGDAAASNKFNVPPSVLEDCASMGIDPPMSAADIPAVAEKVKEKIEFWKSDQKAETERNIAKAQKEIERLETEETSTPVNGTSHKEKDHSKKGTAGVDEGGSVKNEIELQKEAADDVAAELKEAKLEDAA